FARGARFDVRRSETRRESVRGGSGPPSLAANGLGTPHVEPHPSASARELGHGAGAREAVAALPRKRVPGSWAREAVAALPREHAPGGWARAAVAALPRKHAFRAGTDQARRR